MGLLLAVGLAFPPFPMLPREEFVCHFCVFAFLCSQALSCEHRTGPAHLGVIHDMRFILRCQWCRVCACRHVRVEHMPDNIFSEQCLANYHAGPHDVRACWNLLSFRSVYYR